jgi:hypothetical protein
MIAQMWQQTAEDVETLFAHHRGTVFGSRAMGYLCLTTDSTTDTARRVANHLNDQQQYRLANQIYARLHTAGKLTRGSHLAYAGSYSEAHPDLGGAQRAIELVEEALAAAERTYGVASDGLDAVVAYAECHRRLAGLHQWRWQLSKTDDDLDRAIQAFEEAVRYSDRARVLGGLKQPGFLAQARLKLVVLLRIRDQNIDRPDQERHRDAIVALAALPGDDPKGLSYLGWLQAITLADLGAGETSLRKALATFSDDSALKVDPQHWEIGRREYALLRRFIEQYLPYLRNHSLVGQITQVLQAGTVR